MPDWMAHVLLAYLICQVLGRRFKSFDGANTALIAAGSLIPDLVKVGLVLDVLGVAAWDLLDVLHMPVGSLLSAALISALFLRPSETFPFLVFGVGTHYALDMLLGHVSGGMLMLFPLSWGTYQLGLIGCEDFKITMAMLVLVLMVEIVKHCRLEAWLHGYGRT